MTSSQPLSGVSVNKPNSTAFAIALYIGAGTPASGVTRASAIVVAWLFGMFVNSVVVSASADNSPIAFNTKYMYSALVIPVLKFVESRVLFATEVNAYASV